MTSGGSSGPGASDGGPAATAAPARPSLVLVAAVTLNAIMANVLVSPVAPDIAADFGAGAGGVGVVVAATTAPGIVAAPLVGALSDRLGRRRVLVPCLVVFGAAGLLCAAAPTFPVLVVLRVVQGVGAAGLLNLAVTIIADHWQGAERARAIGRNLAVLTVGVAVLPPVGGLLADAGGWRLTFAPYALGLVAAVAVHRRLPAGRRAPAPGVMAQARHTAPHLLVPPVPTALAMAFVLFFLLFALSLTVLPVHLADRFALDAGQRGLVLGAPALTAATTALNVNRVRARLGTTGAVVGAWAVMAVAFATVSAARSVVVVVAALLLYGLGEGVLVPVLQDSVTAAAPAAVRGAVVATFISVTRVAQTAGPLVAGWTVEPAGASTLFAAGAALAAGAGLVPWVARRRRILAPGDRRR